MLGLCSHMDTINSCWFILLKSAMFFTREIQEVAKYLSCEELEILKTIQEIDGGLGAKEDLERVILEQDQLAKDKRDFTRENCKMRMLNVMYVGQLDFGEHYFFEIVVSLFGHYGSSMGFVQNCVVLDLLDACRD